MTFLRQALLTASLFAIPFGLAAVVQAWTGAALFSDNLPHGDSRAVSGRTIPLGAARTPITNERK